MYARLVRFAFGPGKRAEAQAIADDIGPLIAEQPGCASVLVFGHHDDGEYGIFVLWASTVHAEAAAAVVRPKLDRYLAPQVDERVHFVPLERSGTAFLDSGRAPRCCRSGWGAPGTATSAGTARCWPGPTSGSAASSPAGR